MSVINVPGPNMAYNCLQFGERHLSWVVSPIPMSCGPCDQSRGCELQIFRRALRRCSTSSLREGPATGRDWRRFGLERAVGSARSRTQPDIRPPPKKENNEMLRSAFRVCGWNTCTELGAKMLVENGFLVSRGKSLAVVSKRKPRGWFTDGFPLHKHTLLSWACFRPGPIWYPLT